MSGVEWTAACRGLVGAACALSHQTTTASATRPPVVVVHRHLPYGLWALAVLAGVVLVLAVVSPWLRGRWPGVWWRWCGFPVAVWRVRWTWRRLTDLQMSASGET